MASVALPADTQLAAGIRQLTAQQVRIGRPLAAGFTAEILAGEALDVNGVWQSAAFKTCKPSGTAESQFVQEANILHGLGDRPDVVKLYGVHHVGQGATMIKYLVIERLAQSAQKYLKKMRSAGHGLQPVVKFLLDVARALQYVHSRQILHSSVKLPNVMLGNNGDVKLIDFGRSLDLDSIPLANLKYNAGTARYRAPERTQLRGEVATPYGLPADVFSFGVLIHEACSGRKAMAEYASDAEIQAAYKKGDALPPIHPSLCPYWLAMLWKMCTSPKPETRPPMEVIVRELAAKLAQLPALDRKQRRKQIFNNFFRRS